MREIERDHTLPRYEPRNFDEVLAPLNVLLERVTLERDVGKAFQILDRDNENVTGPADLSSGESELISLGIECLFFKHECNAAKPNVLLIDEPDVHLHPDLQNSLARFMRETFKDTNVTLVIATHSTAALIEACRDLVDREHLIRFIVIELGIAGRPQAVLELTSDNIDLIRGLINPNQAGRTHARKRRPIVPIADAVRPWVFEIEGKLISYRVPLAKKNRVHGGPTHFMKPTTCIKTTWEAACKDAGIVGTTPKSDTQMIRALKRPWRREGIFACISTPKAWWS